MQIDPELIERLLNKPSNTRRDVESVGEAWPPSKGWKKRVLTRLGLWDEYQSKKKEKKARRKAVRRAKKFDARRRACAKSFGDPNAPCRQPPQKTAAKLFYKSWEWKKARFETLKKYGSKCMCCGAVERIVVDHIKPRSKFPHLELDLNNLQVLCNDCNMGKSNDDTTDFRPDQSFPTER